MATSSVLKMAAILMLAMFAGQLLMATPTLAGLAETCTSANSCDITCFYLAYAQCTEHLFVPLVHCEAFAIGSCRGNCKKY
jgi:hypothetical protein